MLSFLFILGCVLIAFSIASLENTVYIFLEGERRKVGDKCVEWAATIPIEEKIIPEWREEVFFGYNLKNFCGLIQTIL